MISSLEQALACFLSLCWYLVIFYGLYLLKLSMKTNFSGQLLTLTTFFLTFMVIANQPLLAQTKQFTCGIAQYQKQGVWATVVNTIREENIPLIYWVSRWSGVNPEKRCELVSERLQAAYDNNFLKPKYLTTDHLNGNPVICIRVEKDDKCQIILTLKSGDNAQAILQEMLNFRARTRKEGIRLTNDLVFYDNGNTYIDIDVFLDKISLNKD